jgi:FkbM family methyltransferase
MFVARQANRAVRVVRRLAGLGMRVRCRRRGVNWDLDLDEGIDLSIYILGAYEPRTLSAYRRFLEARRDAVVFDIGANVGAHTLHFARLVGPGGRVFAFEATDYAYAKLRHNLDLNPQFASSVAPEQVYFTADRAAVPPQTLCASWPVDGRRDGLHRDSLGLGKALSSARAMTADEFCLSVGISRLDFVKIDVDGGEFSVLSGFRSTLARFQPVLLVELAPYFHACSDDGAFERMVGLLQDLGYDFLDANNGRPLPSRPDQLRTLIPAGASMNAILRPRTQTGSNFKSKAEAFR